MNRATKCLKGDTPVLVALMCLALLTEALPQETEDFPVPAIVSEQTLEGRRVIRYEHEINAPWGYRTPQRDYFHFIPARRGLTNAPLRVVLHSAGHSGDAVLADAFKHQKNTEKAFIMELRLVKMAELGNTLKTPSEATADLTLRRVQTFPRVKGAWYKWSMTRHGEEVQAGRVQADVNKDIPDET